MIKIYCDLDFFESIQFSEKANNFLYKLFKLEIEIYLGIKESELLFLFENEESFLSRFFKSNNLITPRTFDFINDELTFDRFKNKGISIAFTKFIRQSSYIREKSSGILIINSLDDCDLYFKGGYIANINSKNNFNWNKEIFKDTSFPNWSSVLISDNYLFKDFNSGSNLGFHNLKMFFKHFLPRKSSEKIYITIVSSNSIRQNDSWKVIQSRSEWHYEFETFKQSIKEINPGLEINIELFLTKKTIHKRVLITNFTYGWCDKGFKIFDYKNRPKEENDFHYYNLFHNIHDYGDKFYNLAFENLRLIKEICFNTSELFKSQDNVDFDLIFGDVNDNYSSQNLLIKI